jgi:hypothetical protein
MHEIASHARGLRLLACFALLLVAACRSGTEPPAAASITRVGDEHRQGMANAPLAEPLSVRVTDGAGNPVAGVTVTWSVTAGGGSVAPGSSATDANGVASTSWTLGAGAGEQTVTATIPTGATVIFRATALTVGSCPAEPVALGAGGVCLASPAQLASLQVAGGGAGAEFVVVQYFDGNFTRSSIGVEASATGAIAAIGPPLPDVTATAGIPLQGASPVLTQDIAFERQLRRRERATLPRLVGAGRATRAGEIEATPGFNVVPTEPRMQVGTVMTLNANANDACGVNAAFMKQAVVRAMSANAVIVEDTQNPAGFTEADYNAILAEYESVIRPTNVEAFGTHTDIDNNQRVIIFYTIEVNKLTAPNSTSFVGGFFFSRDLFPKTATATTPTGKTLTACAGSNAAEMFYMLAPDPQGCFHSGLAGQCFPSNARSVDFVRRTTLGTSAHEYQHLINASRRLYIIPGATFPEVVWLDEGLAHIAEELSYYRATTLSPRMNLNWDDIRASQPILDALNRYMTANLSRFNSYLRATRSQSPYGESPQTGTSSPGDWDDLETRGAIWAFLRWAADHRGSGDGDVWNRLARDATLTGADNLRNVFGADIGSRFRQWAAANYVDDAPGVPQSVSTFRHPSWNFRSILPPAFAGNNNQYPLQIFQIGSAPATFTLVDGGAGYLRFGVAGNQTATVRVTQAGGGQLPGGASAWVVRTK